MTTLTMNYVVNPLAGLGQRILTAFEISGYYRAARELARLGYYAEAKNCIAMAAQLKDK